MAEESVLSPMGGMDTDDSVLNANAKDGGISLFQTGSYRYALNMRIGSSTEANVGAGENITSTLEVNNFYQWSGSAWITGTAPAGTNKALGRCEDIANGKVYWPVYNSNGNHVILMWIKKERRIYELLRWSGLNFQPENLISMALINKYVLWADGTEDDSNPPRIIDTTSIYSLKSTMGVNFSEYHISLSKWAPLMPALVEMSITEANLFVQHGQFQFTYRYIYTGGFKSTFAPPSIFVTNEVSGDGLLTPTTTIFMLLLPGYIFDYATGGFISHNQIGFYDFVEFIEIAYRESDIAPWKLFQRHPVTSADNTTYYFKNNGSIAIVPTVEALQYFDSVPFKSLACESIDNRPMLGNNEDDVPLTDFAVDTVEVYNTSYGATSWNSQSTGGFAGLSAGDQDILRNINFIQQFSFKSRGLYKLGIIFQHFTGRTGLVISPENWVYQIPASDPNGDVAELEPLAALGFKITAGTNPPDWAVAYQIVRTDCLNFEFFVQGVVNDVIYLGKNPTPATPVLDYQSTPEGAQTILNNYYNTGGQNNLVPVSERLATYYRDEISVPLVTNASRLYFNIKNWVNSSNSSVGASFPSNSLFYNFQKGDRLRFVASDSGNITGIKWYDVEIAEFTGNGVIVNKPSGLNYLPKRAVIQPSEKFYCIEIYRPKQANPDESFLFYEMGEWYPITNARTPSADFAKRDFTWSGQALVTATTIQTGNPIFNKMPIRYGDVWQIIKPFYYDWISLAQNGISVTNRFIQMNPSRDNAGGRWEHNNGRPLVAYQYPPVALIKPTQIRFGGKYLEDSIFIAINTFLDANQYIYPGEYGSIQALVNTSNTQVDSVGNILLAIFEDQTASIYVNRVTIQDLSGRTQVGLSDKVLGSYNTLLGGHGTLNGESVSKNNSRVIFWNAKKGTWVRYSRDGLTAISQLYNMKNWFNDLAALLIDYYGTAEKPRALSVQDNYHETWITSLNHSGLPGSFKGYDSYKCAEFHESQDEWKTIFDYLPDVFARLDNDVYSIIGCLVHIHEAGDDFGSFYGVKKNSAIEFISNLGPRQNKIWQYLNLQATDKWSFPYIRGDYKSNGATIQETEILLENWDTREDIYVVDVLRDSNSVNVTNPIVEGNNMRSRSLDLYMQLDPAVTWLSVFNYLTVGFTWSPKNVKK